MICIIGTAGAGGSPRARSAPRAGPRADATPLRILRPAIQAGQNTVPLQPGCHHSVNPSPHVLIVDDEAEIREVLRRYLGTQGYRVTAAESGEAMRRAMAAAPVDLVLLDLGLPGEDGLTLIRSLREHSSVAVIVVTGRGDQVDRIVGLELGSDDYITKPFDLRELGARVRSVLRRTLERTPGRSQIARFAGWTLDLASRRLESPDGKPVELTTGEYELLAALVKVPGRVLSRDELLAATHNRERGPFDRTIDVQIGRLRRKIEANSEHPEIIKSVRGVGYLFAPKVERS